MTIISPKNSAIRKIICLLVFVFWPNVIAFLAFTISIDRAGVIDKDAIARQETEAKLQAEAWTTDSVLRGLDLYRDAARQWEEAGQTSRSSFCLREVARLEIMMANLDEAANVIQKSRRLDLSIQNLAGLAEDLSLLSTVFLKRGNLKSAQFYDEVAQARAIQSSDVTALAHVFFSSAAISYASRDFSAMKWKLEKALYFFSQNGDVSGQIESYIELAYVQIFENDRIGAKHFAQRAIDLAAKTGSKRGRVLGLIVLGDAHERMGEWTIALSMFREAESLFPDKLNIYDRGVLFNRLAHYYMSYREPEMAQKYFEKSFECYDRTNDDEGRSEVLADLGQLYFQQGDKDRAINAFARSEEIAVRTNDPLSIAVLNLKLGDLYLRNNELPKAEIFFEKSFSYFKKLGVEYRLAELEERFGMIFEQKHDYMQARNLYAKALERNRRILSRLGQAESMFRLARIESVIGNIESSLKFIQNSIELTDLSLKETANSRLESSLRDSIYERYDLYTSLLMRKRRETTSSDYDVRALQEVEKSKARAILENLSLSEANFTADADPATVRNEKVIRILLNAKKDKLTDLLSRKSDGSGIDKLDNEITELQHQLEEIRGDLKEKSPIYSAIKNPAPFDVGEFQSQVLDDNSLLLEFSLGKEESYLWVVGKSTFDSYVLPPREQIESRIEKLRSLLNQGSMLPNEAVDVFQKRVADAEAEYLVEARALSNELLGPAADKLAGKRLIVVADGKIHYFPFAALPVPNSESDDPILLTNEVVYAPSAAALMVIKKISASGKVAEKDLFLVSDPVYSKLDDRLGQNGGANNTGFVANVLGNFRSFNSLESLPRLPATLEEAKSITDVVGSAATTGHTGFAANRENVLNAGIGEYKVIHFATHGLLDEKRPELSGIALSLFDEAGKQQDGGFIRLQDVYGMNLNADLVVLSACDTGLGKEIKGEGLMSLNNAFLQAGAKSVVSSLWRVDDTVTKILMTDFYSGITSENLTTSEALRQAQIKLRNDPRFSSPFYWASFTAQGNFNAAPKLSRSYNAWIFAIGISLIALCGIYWLRRSRNRKSG